MRWFGLGWDHEKYIFSVTRRSRSDGSNSLSQSVSVSTDLTDVALLSEDGVGRAVS